MDGNEVLMIINKVLSDDTRLGPALVNGLGGQKEGQRMGGPRGFDSVKG